MGASEWVVKHSKTIIVAWIVLLAVSVPLAISLDKVLKYEETAFLPTNVESVEADQVLKEKFGFSSIGGGQSYLLITGVNVTSSEARSLYYQLKSSVEGRYAFNITSYYDVLDALINSSYTIAINITRFASNLTSTLYNAALGMNKTYGGLLESLEGLVKAVNATRSIIRFTAEGYLRAFKALNDTSMKLLMLRSILNKTDHAYSTTYSSLVEAYEGLKKLYNTLAMLNKASYSIENAYSKLFFDVTRVYYALSSKTNAYERGALTPGDVGVVLAWCNTSSLGPVDYRLVYAVFNATLPIVARAGSSAVTDELLANLTTMLLTSRLGGGGGFLLKTYSMVFSNVLKSFDARMESDRAVVECYKIMSQDKVYSSVVKQLSRRTLDSLPTVIKAYGGEIRVPGDGVLPASMLASILEKAVSLGPSPSPEKLVNTTVMLGLQQLEANGSKLASAPGAPILLKKILVEGPRREFALELLSHYLEEEAGNNTPPGMISVVVEVVADHDPNATGVLAENGEELEKAVIDAAMLLAGGKRGSGASFNVTPDLLRILYESGGDPRVIGGVAKSLVREEALRMLGNETTRLNATLPGGVSAEEFIGRVVDEALRSPEKVLSSEAELENATIRVLESMLEENKSMPLPANVSVDEVLRDVYKISVEGGSPEPLAYKLFIQGVEEWVGKKLYTNTTGVPEGIVESIRKSIAGMAGSIASSYPCNSTFIKTLVEREALGVLESFMNESEKIRVLAGSLDLKNLVDLAMRFMGSPNNISRSDVEPVAREVLESMLKYAGTYLSMMKSRDNTTIVVVFTPAGSSDREKYLNALHVRSVAEEVFSKSFHGAKAYVAGEVVSKEELKDYGRRDVATVNKISILGALVVLFIVVESIAATAIPFMSVGTAILLASAIVYVIASRFMSISSWARVLMTTTSLGLGIDYSTYYLYRFREYLREGMECRRAAAEALKRAFDAITASALAVIIAFASFMIAWDFPFLRVMGVVIPIAVASVFAASTTLVPAIAAEVGGKRWFWWPRRASASKKERGESRVVSVVTRYAPVVVAAALILGAPATIAFVNFTGSHDISLYLPQGSETQEAFHLMEEKLGASLTSPTFVVLELKKPLDEESLRVIDGLCRDISSISGVEAVYSPTRPFGEELGNLSMSEVKLFNGTAYVSSDGRTVLIKVTLKYPAESSEAAGIVGEIRGLVKKYEGVYRGVIGKCYVGGMAAMNLDLDNMINESFWHKILPVAVVLMFLSLLPTLKGLPAAAATMTTIYLGATWSLWLSTELFHHVLGKPMLWFLPMVVLVILMGVGIDYNSFYLVRARDEYERKPPRKALSTAAASANKVVIGLSAILAATYASLSLTRMWAMREMGITLVLGIMLTSISAVYLVSPALMSLFGEKAWWPWKHKAGRK